MAAGTAPTRPENDGSSAAKPNLPPGLQFPGRDPSERIAEALLESCAFKAAAAAIAGGGLGVALGLFVGGFSTELDRTVEAQAPWRQQLRAYGRALAAQIRTYSKNFALWGATYTITECSVEKYRARHDLWNSLIAGCMTGAVLASQPRTQMSLRTRGQQMSVGCLGVAAFSCAIDYWLEHRHE
ncbi:mitochondrial import inner membrane translocase, subunit [Cyanidiococcus yangmingshanensis]|uniref:Mitochondrial import inner membrane translocase subunit TIM22 n=1 Tax=Cyanidiococcus yangmingshanensis TaxID=2690220 RepID=A0A7J7IQZ2_9RHOD|nr:mitochondrial import inner membrane translocase, subunit [Cyanidiococcus yangmingshanensis]